MNLSFKSPYVLSCLVCLPVFLLGCSKSDGPVATAKLTGIVTINGKPLPGGTILLKPKGTGAPASGAIFADGSFSVTLTEPGEMMVAIDNANIKTHLDNLPEMKKDFVMKGKAEDLKMMMKVDPMFGVEYVPIPSKYKDAAKSGLVVTVGRENLQKDFPLTD